MTEQATSEIVPINSAEDFFAMLTVWHDQQVLTLEHMLQIPEGTEVQVNGQETLVLEGNVLKAFQAGIQTALQVMGKLPFDTVPADEPEAP